ncbi:Hypothetical predicted protein, partial [Pelobates cultripes]
AKPYSATEAGCTGNERSPNMAAEREVLPTPAHSGTKMGAVKIRHLDSQPVRGPCGSHTYEDCLPDKAFQVTAGHGYTHHFAAPAASAWAHTPDDCGT